MTTTMPKKLQDSEIALTRIERDWVIYSSRVTWQEEIYAPGSSVTVETSVDEAHTFDRCTNGDPIPRLEPGVTKTVLLRVTLTRASADDRTPVARNPQVEVFYDRGPS